jgi:peptide/nickel transport system permease protein
MGGAIFILLIVVLTLAVPLLAIPDPLAQDIANSLQPIGSQAMCWAPIDRTRHAVEALVRARIELVVALGATAVALVLGVTLGMLGGFLGALAETHDEDRGRHSGVPPIVPPCSL